MTEYIDRKTLIKAVEDLPNCYNGFSDTYDKACIIGLIEELPSADVVERKKGKWQITDAYPHNVYCSECHKKFAQTHWAVWEDGSLPRNFCPNCGSRMDLDGDTE